MLEQVKTLLALLRQKHPPVLLVAATVLSIVASVLTTMATSPAPKTTTVVQAPTPAKVKAASLTVQSLPTTCNPPVPAVMGACAPRSGYQALAAVSALAHVSTSTMRGQLGPDVSSYQPSVIWSLVKRAGFRFAFVKATEGPSYTNPYFARYWRELHAVGLAHGAYDFARPQAGWSGAADARRFHAVVKAAGGFDSLPPVLDVEASVLSPAATHRWVAQWVAEIRRLTGRHDVIIYTGAWFWDPRVAGPSLGTKLWVSGYASAVRLPRAWNRSEFWQFTDGAYGPQPHYVPGIGRVDVSVYRGGNLAALAQQAHRPTAAEKRAAALRVARRAHRIVHAKIRRRCRGRSRHGTACHVLFARNGRLHAKYGKALG